MRKKPLLLRICIACACMLQLFSCIKPPPDFDPRDGNNVYTGCRIKSLNGFVIKYNSNNDPVSFIHDGSGTGNPNMVFKYDNKGRLIEYTGLYDDRNYEYMHKYVYDHQRIYADTMYIFGTYGVPNHFPVSVYYPQYDALNRVVKDSVVELTGVTSFRYYLYNPAGNLAVGGYQYDTQLNPHRTNKIWMFVDRNYSVNNPYPAKNYNSSGLPLTYTAKSPPGYVFFLNYYAVTSFAYDCK